MGGSKTVPADLADGIEDAVNETTELWESDAAAARVRAQETWELLPEPKLEVTAYPHFMADSFTRAALKARDLVEAEHWLEVANSFYSDPPAAIVAAHAKLEGGIRYERGDLNGAYEAWTRAMKTLKGSTFTGLPDEYRRFFADRKAGKPTREPSKGPREAPQEISPEVATKIDQLCEQAEAADDADDSARTIELFEQAYDLLPEPKTSHEDSLRVNASLGDVLYLDGRVEEAEGFFQQALQSPGGIGNPFVWLRLGEIHFDQGDKRRAADELTSAFILEGEEIFASEDPKYRALLKEVLLPEEKRG